MDLMIGSRRAGAGVAAAFAAILVLAAAPAAWAHAAYKDSTPADGATVSSPPSSITAEFTEPITNSSYLEVYDPCGERVDDGNSQVSGYEMSISMSADKAGKYVVEFAAQSVDTHVTYGSFSFTSSGGAACAGSEPQESGGGGSSGGGGGGSSGGVGSGSSSGGGSPGGSSSEGGANQPVAAGGAGGKGRHARHDKGGKPAKSRQNGGRDAKRSGAGDEAVRFENTGGQAPQPEPAAWDLPIGAVLMALVLCVTIGAAGGRVYAGIVGPTRR